MIFADHLSRNVHPNPSVEPTLPSLDLEISSLELNASPSKLELIRQESERDPQLLMLKKLIIQGWPKDIKECPTPVKTFWNFRDELSIIDGIVAKGNRIVVPMKFRQELLSLLHDDSHLGVEKCIQRAKGCVYWPNILEDIKSIVHKCEKCLVNCRCNQKEPNLPIEIPVIAWKTMTTDLFVINDKTYILVIDLFSHFPVIRKLAGERTHLVLDAIKNIFSDFGIPEAIISNNGPCYKSHKFAKFCQRFKIRHITGSAYNHQANAIAERSIQTIKHLMHKNPNDQWLALLIFKSTPITGIDKSPSELLCNRKFRTYLPLIQHTSELASKAKLCNHNDV